MAANTGGIVGTLKRLAQDPAVRQKVVSIAKDPKVQAQAKKYGNQALNLMKNRKAGGSGKSSLTK